VKVCRVPKQMHIVKYNFILTLEHLQVRVLGTRFGCTCKLSLLVCCLIAAYVDKREDVIMCRWVLAV
jgi:hypothetical protein